MLNSTSANSSVSIKALLPFLPATILLCRTHCTVPLVSITPPALPPRTHHRVRLFHHHPIPRRKRIHDYQYPLFNLFNLSVPIRRATSRMSSGSNFVFSAATT